MISVISGSHLALPNLFCLLRCAPAVVSYTTPGPHYLNFTIVIPINTTPKLISSWVLPCFSDHCHCPHGNRSDHMLEAFISWTFFAGCSLWKISITSLVPYFYLLMYPLWKLVKFDQISIKVNLVFTIHTTNQFFLKRNMYILEIIELCWTRVP